MCHYAFRMNTKEKDQETNLSALLADLYYPSESDEPIEWVDFAEPAETPLTADSLKALVKADPAAKAEERTEEDFWAPLVEEQDWYEEEEKATVERFKALREEINRHLTCRQVFRVGETEVDLYLLGRDEKGHWAGLKTMVVET